MRIKIEPDIDDRCKCGHSQDNHTWIDENFNYHIKSCWKCKCRKYKPPYECPDCKKMLSDNAKRIAKELKKK